MGNLCCAREHLVQFFVQFFTKLNFTVELRVYGALYILPGSAFTSLHGAHIAFRSCMFFSEQTATFALYSIN
jgi:hypothetical protein